MAADADLLGVGAGRDQDGVAGLRRVHGRLDGGVLAAAADQQEVMVSRTATAVVDRSNAGQRIGAFICGGDDPVAGLEAEVRCRQGFRIDRPAGAGVGEGVGAGAALEGIIAATAGEGDVDRIG